MGRVLSVWMPIVFTPQAQDTAQPQLLSEAVELLKANRLEEAEEAFLEALEGGEDSVALRHNLGIVYQRLRRHEEAVDQFGQALQLDQKLPGTRALLGASLLALSRTDEAIRELELAVEALPRDLLIRTQLATAYEAAGRIVEATQQYWEISRLDPENPEAIYQLGKAYAAVAEWSYREMVRTDPGSARIAYALGQTLLRRGEAEAATRHLKRATEIDPAMPDVHLVLAQALLQQGELEEALKAVEAELVLIPWNAGAREMRARIKAQLQK
jgi:Flp pilus assembly protein TadD